LGPRTLFGVSTVDWFVLGIVALAGIYGLTRGLVRGALSLAGFALGAYLGARLAPAVLADGSPYAPLIALGAALLAGTFLSGLAEMLGVTLRSTLGAVPGLRAIDSVAGGVLGAAAGVVLCWALGAVLLYLPGQSSLREAVQESRILSRINEEFPPERLLETLERVDPIGVLVGPPAEVPPPDTKLTRDPDVRRAAQSVVRITGTACGLGVEGSGWIVRRGWVVTNAHVIAGVERPRVDRRNGDDIVSAVMAIDVKNDLAVLRVPGLRGRPLRFTEPESGVPVALIGYPGNGPLQVIPARLGGTSNFVSRDAYGEGPVTRTVTAIRGTVRPGLSGGPGIDAAGRVRTTVFARRPGERGGYGIPPELMRRVLERATAGGAALVSDCAR
jgi:S1-C subfamily serine protease